MRQDRQAMNGSTERLQFVNSNHWRVLDAASHYHLNALRGERRINSNVQQMSRSNDCSCRTRIEGILSRVVSVGASKSHWDVHQPLA